MASYRVPTEADGPVVLEAIHRYLTKIKKRSRKPWVQCIDEPTVIAHLNEVENIFVVDEAFLVWFELGVPWFTKDLWLHEKLVLSIKPGGDFKSVCDFLEASAAREGARWGAAGTALAINDRALARLYERCGWTPSIISLTKEIAVVR